MGSVKQRLLVCNCEKSMKVDGGAIARALDVPELHVHSQLCRAEIGIFEQALAEEGGVFVACTQESPLFAEVAEESGREHPQFGNIRELAGWTADTQPVAPKMAALIAAAALPTKPARLRRVENDGLCLVVGAGQAAFDAAVLLNRTLSVTLLLTNAEDVLLPLVLDFPVFSGRVARATGSLGAFEIVVDGYAPMLPSSRGNTAIRACPRRRQIQLQRSLRHERRNRPVSATGGARRLFPGRSGRSRRRHAGGIRGERL